MRALSKTEAGLFLSAVYTCVICLVAGHKSPQNYKVPVNFRKVLVEEVRFRVCHGDSIGNSSAKNDALPAVLGHNSGPVRTDQQQENTRDDDRDRKTKKSHERGGGGLRKRFAISYACPMANGDNFNEKHKPDPNTDDDPFDDVDTGEGPQAMIVDGDPAMTSWPFMASIQYLGLDMDWHHFCGGSLIQNHWVVTAAHCVNHIQDYYIRVVLGDYQLSKFSLHREQIKNPERIFMHKDFNNSTYHFDIAMIKLQSDARITKYVTTIEVATEQEVSHLDLTDTCYIAGWGNVIGTTTQLFLSDVLQQSQMRVMAKSQCQAWVSSTLIDSEICVYSDEASACTGDSGGPLVCLTEGEWLLVGSASFIVSPTCEPRSPNVYTRVSNYVYWMAAVIHLYDPDLANA